MDKIWVKDVKEGDRPKSIFLVARKATPTAKSGKPYLSVTFQDKTGELEARVFEKVEETAALFEEKDLVEVEGIVGTFQGKPQLKIESIAKVDAAGHEPTEFAWVAPPEPKKPEKPAAAAVVDDALWNELLGLVGTIADPHVRALVTAFVEDEDVAHRLADQYPQVDRDLLVAGAFLHDLGKIRELQGERNAEYTDEGRLVGHHVMAAQWIHDKARRVGVPRDLEHHVVHLVLAHHGKLEYGSPKVPMTLEALLTHYIDDLDSRVNSWLNLMGREGGTRRWTSSDNVYEQSIWRGALPTVQVEKKGPPAELLTPVIYVPRTEGAVAAKPEGAPARAEERPPRPERPDRGPRDQHRGFGGGGFGDKKKGYMGPRLPGDSGPRRAPEKKEKALTHNPFAALAAKLGDAGKAEGKAEETPPAAEAVETGRVESAPVEPAAAPTSGPAETAPESKPE